MKNKVYLISGTLGTGKSTVTKLLVDRLANAVRIEADDYLHDTENRSDMNWEDRLEHMWSEVISTATAYLNDGKNAVIDGLVEDELPQLTEAFRDQDLHYCILVADENVLIQRIEGRGDKHSIERSMEILKQFINDPAKKPYLIDVSHLTPNQVLERILELDSVQKR